MKIIKITSIIILVLAILVFVYFYILPRLALGPGIACNDELIREYNSPNGSASARLVVRNCGATTDFLTYIQVGEEKAISIKGYHSDDIEITWEGNDDLMIKYSGDSNLVESLNQEVEGIQIDISDRVNE